MNDCIFCKIVKKEIPADIVYEDDNTLAFLDVKPNSPGHTLIIPKEHFENIYTIPEDLWTKVSLVVQKIARNLQNNLKPDGMNLVMNNGAAAGQIIFHAHLHVIPRYK